jgi:hypothetical protein
MTAIRDVEISPMSARDELISVARAGMAIAVSVALYLANNPFPSGAGVIQRNLLPFQALVQSRSPAEQLIFRELQVALLEAEGVRSSKGSWPEPAAMAAEGIEPFAVNPAIKGPAYQWRLLRDGRFINYTGVAGQASAPAWLILVQEPDPSVQPDVFVDDEEHDRLLDGSILHVSIWIHPTEVKASAVAVRVPQAEGWIQLYAAGISSDIAPRSPAPATPSSSSR